MSDDGSVRSDQVGRQGGRTQRGLRGVSARPAVVRAFDPAIDDARLVGFLNDWDAPTQAKIGAWYTEALRVPDNLLVAVDAEHGRLIVGCIHVFDAGLPYAVVESAYLHPSYRTLANARRLIRAALSTLSARGVRGVALFAPPRLAKALQREGFGARSTYTLMTQELPHA